MNKGLVMKYFVLKPKGTNKYAEASRAAMLKYAEVIKEENPVLAEETEQWVFRILVEMHEGEIE